MTNAAFANFETAVILAYDTGLLNQKKLTELMEPYRGTHMDSSSMAGTLSFNGLDIKEIVLLMFYVKVPPHRPINPKNQSLQTLANRVEDLQYCTLWDELFKDVTAAHGWL